MSDDLVPPPPEGCKGADRQSVGNADKAYGLAALVLAVGCVGVFPWLGYDLEEEKGWRAYACLLLFSLMVLGWVCVGWQKLNERSSSRLMTAAWSLSVGISLSSLIVVFIAPRAFLAPASFFQNIFMAGIPLGVAHFIWKKSRTPASRGGRRPPVSVAPTISRTADGQATASTSRPDAEASRPPDFFVIGFFFGMLLFAVLLAPYNEFAGPFEGNGFGGRSPSPGQNELLLAFSLGAGVFTAIISLLCIWLGGSKSFFQGLMAGCGIGVLWKFAIVCFGL